MKKIFKLMASVLTIASFALITSCNGEDKASVIEVNSVTVEPIALNLEVGFTQTLTATLDPANATQGAITWESYDKTIATVAPVEGSTTTVTGVSTGTVTIAAVASNNKRAICEVTVTKSVPLTAITIVPDEPSYMEPGDTVYLLAIQSPANATDYNPVWTSSNTNVATVSSGRIIAIGTGTSRITVTSGNISNYVEVTVTSPLSAITITPNGPISLAEIGTNQTLTATPVPANAANYNPVWESDNENIVTVSPTGEITAIRVGTAIVTVTSGNISNYVEVTVWSAYLSDISLSPTTAAIPLGETQQIEAIPIPSTAQNYSPSWSSSDESVATVSSTGLITGLSFGTAVITVTSGSITKSITASIGMNKYSTEGWTATCRNGNHTWDDLGSCGPYPPSECDGGIVGGTPELVLDGNVWTGWHSSSSALPQCLVVDMKDLREVDCVGIKHRPDAIVHNWYPVASTWIYIKTVEIYLSDELVVPNVYQSSWGSSVATYTYPGGVTSFTIDLKAGSKGRYLILYFRDSNQESYISFTELDVYKKF
jgi:uncharacterized protein YjdB